MAYDYGDLNDPKIQTLMDIYGIAGPPEQREYATLTGEDFFSGDYGAGAEYYDPFYEGGTYGNEELARMYAGIPVVSGYYDPDRNFVAEQSLYNQASGMRDLNELGVESFEDWIARQREEGGAAGFQPDLTQTDEYQTMQEMQALLSGEGQTEGDMTAAETQAALSAGFVLPDGTGDVDAYRAARQAYQTQLDQGEMAQTGVYGTEFEDMSRKAHSIQVQTLVDSNMQMIEALGMKSSAAAYAKMNEVSSQIANVNIQYETKLMEQDLLMRQIEYEAMVGRLKNMQDQGLAVQDQFLTQLRTNRMGALEAAAQGINVIVQTNDAYFKMHERDLDAVRTEAGLIYQRIMVDIEVNQAAMERANLAYEAYMAPHIDALNEFLVMAQLEDLEGGDLDINAAAALGITGASAGAIVGMGIGGPIGAGIGLVIGGLIGFLGGLFS